jgi:hypothetical protein
MVQLCDQSLFFNGFGTINAMVMETEFGSGPAIVKAGSVLSTICRWLQPDGMIGFEKNS